MLGQEYVQLNVLCLTTGPRRLIRSSRGSISEEGYTHLPKIASPGILLSLTSGSEIESPTTGLRPGALPPSQSKSSSKSLNLPVWQAYS